MNDSLYFIERFCFSVGASLSAIVIAFTMQYWEAGYPLPNLLKAAICVAIILDTIALLLER